MKTRQVRLRDVAEKAGVSSAAASRVLNSLPIRISKEKRQAILKFAESLRYRPNLLARGLRNNRTKCIGIIVPDMSTLFYPRLIQLIEKHLARHNYRAIICDTGDDLSREREYVDDLLSRQVDGLIVAPASGETNIAIFENLTSERFPIILMDRYFPGRKLNYVVTDNKLAARKAVRVVVKGKKRSRLFYVGQKRRNFAIDERLSGVKEGASCKGIAFTGKDIFLCGATLKDIGKAGRQIFSGKTENPAIVLESNRFLMGLLDAACEKGFLYPRDFVVVGFDAFRPELLTASDFSSLRVLDGGLHIVEQPVAEMAQLVADYVVAPGKRRNWRIKLKAEITGQSLSNMESSRKK